MDGLLIVDKPVGPTSHDVVSRLRRVLRERRVGHTGTLDPAASGVLPIVIGRATRLARFLSGAPKTYDATVRLGFATTTGDAMGDPLSPVFAGPLPGRTAIDAALGAFRGAFLQQPPAFSAKKIGGQRSYALARRRGQIGRVGQVGQVGQVGRVGGREGQVGQVGRVGQVGQVDGPEGQHGFPDLPDLPDPPDRPDLPDLPDPVSVTVHALELLGVENDLVTLRVKCSAGFYVRSLAQDLGMALGTGAHLAGLRRIRSGSWDIDSAVPLDDLERDPEMAAQRVVPLAGMLTDYPSIVLSIEGARHAVQGRTLGPADVAVGVRPPTVSEEGVEHGESGRYVRLLTPGGELLGLADRQAGNLFPGALHPSVVLG